MTENVDETAACRSCKRCFWYVEFPWYVARHEGYCNHPLVTDDPRMRLYTAGQARACMQFLSREAALEACREDMA